MNEIGNPNALQSVLGWEIDELGQAWFLDQGHVEDAIMYGGYAEDRLLGS